MGGNTSKYTPPFNDSIMQTVAITPKITAVPSIIGSCFIIQDVLRDKQRRQQVYHRIMVGMSTMDLLWSVRCFLSTWIIPHQFHPVIPYASGTHQTCVAIGFLGHAAAITSVLYSAGLTLFFLLVVRFGWQEQRIRKYVEPWIHAIPFILGWGMAIVSIQLRLYKPIPWTCFIQDIPYACKKAVNKASVDPSYCLDDSQQPHINAGVYRWAFFFAWIWAVFFFILIALLIIYRGIRTAEQKTSKYVFSSASAQSSASFYRTKVPDPTDLPTNTVDPVPTDDPLHNTASKISGPPILTKSSMWFSTASEDACEDELEPPIRPTLLRQHSQGINEKHSSQRGLVTPSENDDNEIINNTNKIKIKKTTANRTCPNKRQNSIRFANQAALYVVCFSITWIFSTIQGSINSFVGTGYSYLLVLITIMAPLQGFFNALIYLRPRYIKRFSQRSTRRR